MGGPRKAGHGVRRETMEQDEVAQLLSMAGSLLGQAMRLHDLAIRTAAGLQTPQYRVNALFSRAIAEPAETRLVPYRTVLPGVVFGFEDPEACSAILREHPREGGGNRVRIELREVGQSRWFALQVDLPWPAIRQAEHLDLAFAGAASQELRCSATLAAFDIDATRHDLGSVSFWLRALPGTTRVSLPYALPEATRLDFAQEAKLIVFFPVEPFTADLDYIEITPR
jgi:hypothetical protein